MSALLSGGDLGHGDMNDGGDDPRRRGGTGPGLPAEEQGAACFPYGDKAVASP